MLVAVVRGLRVLDAPHSESMPPLAIADERTSRGFPRCDARVNLGLRLSRQFPAASCQFSARPETLEELEELEAGSPEPDAVTPPDADAPFELWRTGPASSREERSLPARVH